MSKAVIRVKIGDDIYEGVIAQGVKAEPKWELDGPDSNVIDVQYLTLSIDCSKDQAQLIKDWISEGMEYITGETDRHNGYIEAMDKVRAALEDK